jgi:hypothetical protein
MANYVKRLQEKYFTSADLYLNHLEEETFLKCMHQTSLISKVSASNKSCTTTALRDYEGKLKHLSEFKNKSSSVQYDTLICLEKSQLSKSLRPTSCIETIFNPRMSQTYETFFKDLKK